MARLFALLAAALLAGCSAQGGDAVAKDGRVRDLANILDADVEARLAHRLAEAERLYGPQVGVVTVQSLEGQPIEAVSLTYANEWALGDAQRNDGLLVLVAPTERKVRIEVGKGLEGHFPDEWAQGIIDSTLLPQFRQQNYGRGLEGAVDMIVARMRQFPTRPANDNAPSPAQKAA